MFASTSTGVNFGKAQLARFFLSGKKMGRKRKANRLAGWHTWACPSPSCKDPWCPASLPFTEMEMANCHLGGSLSSSHTSIASRSQFPETCVWRYRLPTEWHGKSFEQEVFGVWWYRLPNANCGTVKILIRKSLAPGGTGCQQWHGEIFDQEVFWDRVSVYHGS